jgi:integrase
MMLVFSIGKGAKLSEKRKDKRGRILRTGESQDMVTGEYRFSYYEYGKKKNFRSWRLNATDPLPEGKRPCLSLREKEEKYKEAKRKGISFTSGDITVNELVDSYIKSRSNGHVKNTTRYGYATVQNFLKKEEFCNRKIRDVTTVSAMEWLAELQASGKRRYSSIQSIRGVLRPAFRKAVQSGWIEKNPFDDFQIHEVIVNDSVRRDALSRGDERRYLEFVKNDKHYSRYYEGIYILFNTGMRISEFCGLTLDDLDMEKRTININKQLQRTGHDTYIEDTAKTKSGTRTIPMEDGEYEAFKVLIERRKQNPANPSIDGVSNFICLDKDNHPMLAMHWEHYFNFIEKKYNKIYRNPIQHVTPHVCRHTYCSKKAKAGMNPVHLAYLMGHSEVDVTLNTYTHTRFNDALEELQRLGCVSDTVNKDTDEKEEIDADTV